jgi:hypothetical protein
VPNHWGILGVGAFDLQTAAAPRQVVADGLPVSTETVIYTFDAATWATIQTEILPRRRYVLSFEFWRGRHTPSVRTSPRRWQIRLSAPSRAPVNGWWWDMTAGPIQRYG